WPPMSPLTERIVPLALTWTTIATWLATALWISFFSPKRTASPTCGLRRSLPYRTNLPAAALKGVFVPGAVLIAPAFHHTHRAKSEHQSSGSVAPPWQLVKKPGLPSVLRLQAV